MRIGQDYGASTKTPAQLLRALPALEKAADKFSDKNGIIGNNVSARKLAAYKWQLNLLKS